MLYPVELRALNDQKPNIAYQSGRQDSNLRPPAPKAGAITGLRYAPFFLIYLQKYYLTTNENKYYKKLKDKYIYHIH